MKLNFLELPPDERRLYIEQAALRRNVSVVIREKDLWGCWLLGEVRQGSPVSSEVLELADGFVRRRVFPSASATS